jgi:predicted  nucleic acid-binding Zn-ribbon protein
MLIDDSYSVGRIGSKDKIEKPKRGIMNRYILPAIILSTAAVPAFAEQIEKKDKWVLNEVVSGNSTYCIASTEDKGFIRTYTLKIQKTKNSSSPAEIFFAENGTSKYGPLAATKLGNEVALFNQISAAPKALMFWYLPDETKLLLDTLKTSTKNIEVNPVGDLDGGKVSFSTKGAAQILATMEKRCNNGKPLIDERASALTNHPAEFDRNPKLFEPSQIATLRSLNVELASHHNSLLAEEVALVKLTEQNLPKINERNANKTEQAELTNRKIPTLKNDIQSASLRIQNGEARLVQLVNEIPAAKKVKDAAQVKYDEADRLIAPHRPRHNELTTELSSLRSDLSRSESEISTSVSEINNNTQEISRLDREAQSLNSQIQSLRSDLPSAQARYDRARREYERFDSRVEINRRLATDSNYRLSRENADRIRVQLNGEKEDLRSLERDLTRARSQLAQCLTVEGADCSSQQAAVNSIESEVSSKKAMISRLENQYENAHREVLRVENEVERDVNREADSLRRDYDVASSRLNTINSELQQAEGERRDITEYQIPRLQNRNADLRNYVSDLERAVSSLQQNIRFTQNELSEFNRSVGYDRLQQNVNSTYSALQAATSTHNRLVNEDASLKVQIPKDKALLVQLNETLKASEARLVVVTQTVVRLNSELAGYDQTKADIESRMASIQDQIRSAQTRYTNFFI